MGHDDGDDDIIEYESGDEADSVEASTSRVKMAIDRDVTTIVLDGDERLLDVTGKDLYVYFV